jgi:hypothetical protein
MVQLVVLIFVWFHFRDGKKIPFLLSKLRREIDFLKLIIVISNVLNVLFSVTKSITFFFSSTNSDVRQTGLSLWPKI